MDVRPDAPAAEASKPTLAAVELHGHLLRYGEVVREDDSRDNLRRLGTCEFDFDVVEAVFGDGVPANFDTVTEAVTGIFGQSNAPALNVAVHPPAITGFFSPLPESMPAADKHEQLRQEAALLADIGAAQSVRIRAVPVRSELITIEEEPEPHQWHHVLHIPEPVHARLTLMARALNMGTYELLDTTRAASNAVHALDGVALAGHGSDVPYTLVVGAYPDHVELSILHYGEWFHGHHGPVGDPNDAAYFAAALLDKIGLGTTDVGRFLLYGEEATPRKFRLLADLLDHQPELFNPLEIFGRTSPGATPEVLATYTPCIGALIA